MFSLIEKFIDDLGKMRILLVNDKRNNDYPEVYFFQGKESVLCISKQDSKILQEIKYNQLSINITNANEFAFNCGGQSLFFCQDSKLNDLDFQENLYKDERISNNETSQKAYTGIELKLMNLFPDEKYKYKAFCEKCNSRKCSQFDTINGRRFKFGKGQVSDDMLNQYDKYCENKIEKFGCSIE